MQRDLNAYNASTTQPGARLQYVARFMTGEDVYHMDIDFQPGRTPQVRFFGGLLDADDGVQNGSGATVGSRYVADAGFNVTDSLRDGVITLMAPKTLFGVNTGSPLFSVTGFSMAGPSEQDTSAMLVANSMRTIDASNEYRPPTHPSSPDGTGRIDLDSTSRCTSTPPLPGTTRCGSTC